MTKTPSSRSAHVTVKTAKGRKISSTQWLQRQLNDPYVQRAKQDGYRSRAAYKLLEIHEKFSILRPGKRVVDLGAAPGGWTQVAAKYVQAAQGKGKVIGIDLTEMHPIEGAILLQGDFLEPSMLASLETHTGTEIDVVLSDMAAPACGHPSTDHLRSIVLCEASLEFAKKVLVPGGSFVAKILKGGEEQQVYQALKACFKTVKYFKPPCSRAHSTETYLVALDYKNFDATVGNTLKSSNS